LSTTPGFIERLELCSINLSGLSLSDETMLEFISKQFRKWQIPTYKICFEITETAAISNLSYAKQFIDALRKKGCLFSLDDFGSGLSSFAYLKNLPVDYLKIDGLFVKDILEDKIDWTMVKAINEVGHVMNKKTIAEFVENQNIFELLKTLGVNYAQGYGIAKPIPLREL
jgi:EAL domain-containing protein (putative c-di-GMP-specific phosphodiesterase class I)